MENNNPQFSTPILFIIFNRPDTTMRVFEAIKKIKPAKLYIVADGPRPGKEGEARLCEETRQVTEAIDWPCEVQRKYSDKNLGCKMGVSGAVSWFFENVEEGIILEDDCLPDPSFFAFCRELLEKYKDVGRVKMIAGTNFHFGKRFVDESYYFSRIPSIWGWATWRRAWLEYDLPMKTYPEFKEEDKIRQIFKNKQVQEYFVKTYDRLYDGKVDTWDGQWVYSIHRNNGTVIVPCVNLISNIGFGDNATHTKEDNRLSDMPTEKIGILMHPQNIVINELADLATFKVAYYRSLTRKILEKILKILK